MQPHLCEKGSGRPFIEEDLRKAIGKKDKHAYLHMDQNLEKFKLHTYQEMINSRDIAELKGVDMYEYRFKLTNRIGRIFFYKRDEVAHMLYLFIKKSSRAGKTDQKHVEIALKRMEYVSCINEKR